MVRKRTRKYDSDENDSDSDADFEVEERARPTPKRYSLRERKNAATVSNNYDFYVMGEDEEAKPSSSDDEDFEVEENIKLTRPYFEPDDDINIENAEGLIDFEDIIRADIVVNKKKIDYDNLIQKTEIKFTEPPKKRGRKPKNYANNGNINGTGSSSTEDEEKCAIKDEDNETCKKEEISQNETGKEILEPEIQCHTANESLPNEDNAESKLETTNAANSKTCNNFNIIENDTENKNTQAEDDDDDVIVLETKNDVIVLDD